MGECKNCANMDNEYCFACDNGNQFKPMTNANRIRSMSEEELATMLNRHCSCSSLRTWHEGMCDKPCRECWLDWLKQECAE